MQKVLQEYSQEEDLDSNAQSLENYEDIPISRGKSFIQDDLLKESGIVKTDNLVILSVEFQTLIWRIQQ